MEAGWWTTPFAGAFILGSMLTPAVARRVRPGYVIGGGLALAAVGFALLTRASGASGPALLVVAFVVYSLGLAPVFTLATDLMIGSAPPERAGAAAAISEAGSEFGGALGIAMLGSLGTAVYRGELARSMPSGVSSSVAEAARQTLGGAMAAAEGLSAHLGAALSDAARDAFARSFATTAAVCAVLLVGLTIVAGVLLRQQPTSARP